jgi:DNA-binding transcriptional LysR family regulator
MYQPFAPRQLAQFVAVAETLSFRGAAQRLHMSQPPLTQAIQRLERSLGVKLLERSRASVRLTAAGEVFLEEARRLLARTQDMMEATRRAAEGARGRLRIAFVPSAALRLLPAIIIELRRRYPEIELELRSETTTMQLASLRDDRADAGILVPPLRDAADLRTTPLRRERIVAAVPASHALAARTAIRLRELAEEPFILFPLSQGPAFLSAILLACRRAGFFPRVVQEAAQVQMILTLVACGMGVSLVPAAMRAVQQFNVRYLEIRDRALPDYQLAAAIRRNADNVVLGRFLEVARQVASR